MSNLIRNLVRILFFALIIIVCDTTECGERKIINTNSLSLIRGGESSYPGQWPWLASLHGYRNGGWHYFCGSSLVSQKMLITGNFCSRPLDSSLNFVN